MLSQEETTAKETSCPEQLHATKEPSCKEPLLLHIPASPLLGSRVSNRERKAKDHLVYLQQRVGPPILFYIFNAARIRGRSVMEASSPALPRKEVASLLPFLFVS